MRPARNYVEDKLVGSVDRSLQETRQAEARAKRPQDRLADLARINAEAQTHIVRPMGPLALRSAREARDIEIARVFKEREAE